MHSLAIQRDDLAGEALLRHVVLRQVQYRGVFGYRPGLDPPNTRNLARIMCYFMRGPVEPLSRP